MNKNELVKKCKHEIESFVIPSWSWWNACPIKVTHWFMIKFIFLVGIIKKMSVIWQVVVYSYIMMIT